MIHRGVESLVPLGHFKSFPFNPPMLSGPIWNLHIASQEVSITNNGECSTHVKELDATVRIGNEVGFQISHNSEILMELMGDKGDKDLAQ
ncbi:hypothetical protein L1887_47647 [Cichorium endivia]|nr:hypothetical protein L1887_47647 [Cichorium endivia]